MIKSYTRIIKEDLAPYLVNTIKLPNTNEHYRYVFNISSCKDMNRIYDIFMRFARRYKCWKHTSPNVFSWETKSTVLIEKYNKEEQVEDIPNNIQIISTPSQKFSIYKQLYSYNSDDMLDLIDTQYFKDKQKEKEMNTNKFKVNYIINISVNGNQYSLADPVKPDEALEVVLKLNNRLQFLNDQLKGLEGITEGTEVIDDKINTNNITKVITNEIDEIKEIIDYINDNLDEE